MCLATEQASREIIWEGWKPGSKIDLMALELSVNMLMLVSPVVLAWDRAPRMPTNSVSVDVEAMSSPEVIKEHIALSVNEVAETTAQPQVVESVSLGHDPSVNKHKLLVSRITLDISAR